MPGNKTNFVDGRRGPRHHKYTFKGVLIDHVQDTGLVNGSIHNDCWQAPAPKANGPTHNGTNPQHMVNGYVSQVFRGMRTKTACVPRKESKKSAAPDHLTDERSESDSVLDSILVNGARSPERVALTSTLNDWMALEHDQSATTKGQQKRKKPKHRKRKYKVAAPDNNVLPPQAEEDWESEIQEVELSKWEEVSFGTQPYGPEDVLNFALRDLTLERSKIPMWTVTAKYSPARHHKPPIEWSRYKLPSEPGQFSDAEE